MPDREGSPTGSVSVPPWIIQSPTAARWDRGWECLEARPTPGGPWTVPEQFSQCGRVHHWRVQWGLLHLQVSVKIPALYQDDILLLSSPVSPFNVVADWCNCKLFHIKYRLKIQDRTRGEESQASCFFTLESH